MANKGIKTEKENLAPDGAFNLPQTGPGMVVKTQDGRNPETKRIPVTRRVDHHRVPFTSMGASTDAPPELGKTNQGPDNGE